MILDTNALSAFADGVPPVVQQIAAADELHIPVIVLGECRFGIATSRRRREYEAWLTRARVLEHAFRSGGDCHLLRTDSGAVEESGRTLARQRRVDCRLGATARSAASKPPYAL
jgi:predicted nucleic acid-binding protein